MDQYFDILSKEQINLLYPFQEAVYTELMKMLPADENFALIGGTPLSRCYLNHRVSFDLDFAVNPKSNLLAQYVPLLAKHPKFKLNRYIIGKEGYYDNAFFSSTNNIVNVEFSFIQDRKYANFRFENRKMGLIDIKTVSLDTLYYNKLRTIAGDFRNFNRNKIRDIFDIMVLSNKYMKLDKFIDKVINSIDDNFSKECFYESLISFDWFDINGQCIYPINNCMDCDSLDKLITKINSEADLTYQNDNYWESEEQDLNQRNSPDF